MKKKNKAKKCVLERNKPFWTLDKGAGHVISIKVSAQASGGPNWSVLEKKKRKADRSKNTIPGIMSWKTGKKQVDWG